MIDCLFIGYNEVKLKSFKPLLRICETLKIPSILEKIPYNSEMYSLYKFIQYSWIRHDNQSLSVLDIVDKFYWDKENTDRPKEKSAILNSTIAYLGTYLKRRGFTFDYVNTFNNNKDELSEKLRRDDVLAVAIPTTFYEEPNPIKEVVGFVRKQNRKAKIIIGGPYILKQVQSKNKKELKKLLDDINADFYVVNAQGEAALNELLNALKKDTDLKNIKNIIYKGDNGYEYNELVIEGSTCTFLCGRLLPKV